MSISMVLSAGFLMLGGTGFIAMSFNGSHWVYNPVVFKLGVVMFVLGILPLLLCYVNSLISSRNKKATDDHSNKEE